MKHAKNIHLLVLLILIKANGFAQPALAIETEKKVDNYLAPLLENDLISGSVLIAKNGEILVSKGYGLANREFDIPCSANTKFRLASVSKQFTAMAIMILEEKGLLKTSDTLTKYIPGYPEGEKITIHNLLTHTSGVINYSALSDHYDTWCKHHTIEQVIERFKNKPLRFQPGEKFEYSNSGYVLLANIIEKVSGSSFEEFITENIFRPLEMHDSGIDTHTEIIKNRAAGHYNTGKQIVQADYLYVPYTNGAGSIYSTVDDLYKWDRALYTEKLISKKSIEKMFTPYIQTYGYGWFIREEFGKKLIEHRGGLNGFLTMIQRYTDDDVLVITLFNYVSPFVRELNRGIAAIALGVDYEPILIPGGVQIKPEVLLQYAGKYLLGEDYIVNIAVENDKVFYSDIELNKVELIAQNDVKFYLPANISIIRFIKEKDGAIKGIMVQQHENSFMGKKIE